MAGPRVQVLAFEVETVIGTKGENKGKEFQIPKAQCIVHEEGRPPRVGVWNAPKGHPAVKPGYYTPILKLTVGFDGKIFGAVEAMVPEKA